MRTQPIRFSGCAAGVTDFASVEPSADGRTVADSLVNQRLMAAGQQRPEQRALNRRVLFLVATTTGML
jgi:hypothetical protein